MSELIKKEDLFELISVANPILSPNSKEAVFTRTIMDEEENTYYAHLFHVNIETEVVTQWTRGKERISSVQWSKDGQKISFIAKRDDFAKLYILSTAGGEAYEASAELREIQTYTWNATSDAIIFSAKLKKGMEFGEKEEEEKREKAYHVKGMRYQLNGVGLLPNDTAAQVGILSLETGEIKRLTHDDFDYLIQTSNAQNSHVIVTKWSREDDDDFSMQLCSIDLETKEQQLILDFDGSISGATYSPDEAYLAFEVSPNEPYKNATHNEIYVYDTKQQFTWSLTEMMDQPVGDYSSGDIQQGVVAPSVVWTANNDLYFQMSTMGDVRLYYATLSGAIYVATPEEEHIYGFDITKDGIYALITVSNTTSVGELYLHEIATGERRQLTHFNEAYEQSRIIVKPEIVQVENEGELVWGWFMKPTNYVEGEKYPMILYIHGGPHMMYANTFFHEMQVFAAQGYAVLYMNPRGSQSYSQAFVNGCRGDYGGGDYRDLMAAVDMIVEEKTWIDASRLGVMGGSYGGFMTNWIVGHTDRFKAALTQRSISNWISMYGVSDIGYYFTEWQIDGNLDDVEKLWKHSPLKYVDDMKTPLMILHSEEDIRCPMEQAEQLYIALKAKKKDVEFIRFPKANHDLSRTGLPHLRQQRLEEIEAWFVKKL